MEETVAAKSYWGKQNGKKKVGKKARIGRERRGRTTNNIYLLGWAERRAEVKERRGVTGRKEREGVQQLELKCLAQGTKCSVLTSALTGAFTERPPAIRI